MSKLYAYNASLEGETLSAVHEIKYAKVTLAFDDFYVLHKGSTHPLIPSNS